MGKSRRPDPVKSSSLLDIIDDDDHHGDGHSEDSLELGDEIYRTVDPLDPRKVSMDIFELYSHELLMTPSVGRRAYLVKKMRVSWHIMCHMLYSPVCAMSLLGFPDVVWKIY